MEEWVKENREFDIEICNWNLMLLNFPGTSSNFLIYVIHGGFKGWDRKEIMQVKRTKYIENHQVVVKKEALLATFDTS